MRSWTVMTRGAIRSLLAGVGRRVRRGLAQPRSESHELADHQARAEQQRYCDNDDCGQRVPLSVWYFFQARRPAAPDRVVPP
jgi:hypothetical protein